MGNEAAKQEEAGDNQPEQNPKDEIPADTQLNKQYIDSPTSQDNPQNKEIIIKEEQGPNHLIIKEKNYENNEGGVHTKVNERRVEYRIRKVDQDQDLEDGAENIEYDENIEQMEENAEQMEENMEGEGEGEYEINQQEELGNEEYQEQGEYMEEQGYEGQIQEEANYEGNYGQNENKSRIVINKANSSNAIYNPNSNIRMIKKEGSNIYIQTGGYQGRYTSSYSDIPRYMSFQKMEAKGTGNIRSSLNVVKTEDVSELVEIPKEEYPTYAGRETVFIGGGMETGEYKFKGQGIVITQKGVLEENVKISEEEILKEIDRRKNKPKKEKRKKYVILDKFYAITEFEGKPIVKTEKMEQMQKQYEFNQQQKLSASSKGGAAVFAENSQNIKSSNMENSAQFQQMQFSQYQQSQSESSNINNEMISNSIRFKNLKETMEPGDNFSKALLSQINSIRANPQSYISIIQKEKNNIIVDKRGRLIYNGKNKIALTRGEEAFNEAIDFLKSSKATDRLIYNPYLTVEMPKTENEIRFVNDLRYKVDGLVKKGIIIKSFWRNVIRDPDISFLMMIVDDMGEKSGMRRKDLLDPNMKYIGISSVEINGIFVSYIILCAKD